MLRSQQLHFPQARINLLQRVKERSHANVGAKVFGLELCLVNSPACSIFSRVLQTSILFVFSVNNLLKKCIHYKARTPRQPSAI